MRKKRFLPLIALCIMTILANGVMAQTAMDRLKTEYPSVMEQYGKRLEALKADYIIAIDVSGTMDHYKETVVPALQSFLWSIPDGDYVSIIKFGTIAKEAGLSGQIFESNRNSFKQTLDQIYARDPDCYNQTNICKMLEFVNDRMNRPGHNDLQYVFMFTDFVEEPNCSDAEWDAVATKMKASTNRYTVLPFAMQLNGRDSGKDIPKVRKALSNLRIININSSSELNNWFEEQKADISKSRLKDLIMSDFDKWYSENKIKTELFIGINGDLKLNTNVDAETVPAFVNGFMMTQCEPVSQSNNVEKITIKYDSLFKGRDVSANIGSLKFFKNSLIQKNTKVTVLTAIRPTFITGDKEGEPSFANEIRNLGLEDELVRTTELTAENNFVLGWNIWLFSICCGLLAAWLWLFVMNTLRRHRLGYLNLLISDNRGNVNTHRLPNKCKVTIGANNCDINVPSIASSLILKGLSGSPLSLIKRRVMAECKCAPTSSDFISIGGKPQKSNKFHRLKLQQNASISSLDVLNFSIGENNAKRSNLKYVIACVLFVLVTLAAIAVCLFL